MGRKTRKHPKTIIDVQDEYNQLLAELNNSEYVQHKTLEDVELAKCNEDNIDVMPADPIEDDIIERMQRAYDQLKTKYDEDEVEYIYKTKIKRKVNKLWTKLFAYAGILIVYLVCIILFTK